MTTNWRFVSDSVAANGVDQSGGTKTITVTAPSGIQDGDLLVAYVIAAGIPGQPGLTLPTGFAQEGSLGGGVAYYIAEAWKVASSESGDYSFTFDCSVSTFNEGVCYIGVYRNVATAAAETNGSNNTSTTATATGTNAANVLHVMAWLVSTGGSAPTAHASTTERQVTESRTGSGFYLVVADEVLNSTSVPGRIVTNPGSSNATQMMTFADGSGSGTAGDGWGWLH